MRIVLAIGGLIVAGGAVFAVRLGLDFVSNKIFTRKKAECEKKNDCGCG